MGDATTISWTDATWNPIRGCSRVSEGCRNCYAERVAARFSDAGQAYEGLADRTRKGSKWTGVVRLIPEHLADPLRWKRPRRIFVNSMSDLFHEELDDEQIDLVFAAMLLAPHHTFQVLTKRAARMRAYLENDDLYERVLHAADRFRRERPELNQVGISNPATSPARWIWLGVSVENQAAADERIPELLRTPAAVRFLSCEPLIGPVDLERWTHRCSSCVCSSCPPGFDADTAMGQRRLSWVIAGCESGPGARACSVEWLRSLRDQCSSAGVAFFLKQAQETALGECGDPENPNGDTPCGQRVTAYIVSPSTASYSCGCTVEGPEDGVGVPLGAGEGSKRKGGGVIELPYLDGVQHAAFPGARL